MNEIFSNIEKPGWDGMEWRLDATMDRTCGFPAAKGNEKRPLRFMAARRQLSEHIYNSLDVGQCSANFPLMKKLLTLFLAAVPFLAAAEETETTEKTTPEPIADFKVTIETDKGTIEGVLYASKTPITVANFANLAAREYYDELKFHRVIADFMIQGGCPHGTGTGGPGYRFADEIVADLKHDRAGIFSMANAGPSTNGSQFFITHRATPHLDGRHTVFGHVTKGQDVVDSIAMGDTIKSIRIQGNTDALLKQQKEHVEAWNKVLDQANP